MLRKDEKSTMLSNLLIFFIVKNVITLQLLQLQYFFINSSQFFRSFTKFNNYIIACV